MFPRKMVVSSRHGSQREQHFCAFQRRFFTARDIIDLINNLQKSAKIATEEASSIHGNEQVNRIKAKCSKVCGLANRLIDLYVATIKAKVARILRKLGLGQTRGQELLYHHLMLLQALVDKAFASFNAVQHAEAARIKQAKLGVDCRRENSGAVTWRTPATPADRKATFRPGSLGSLPQPAQHMDVRDLLQEARTQFLLMADELVDLKNKIISIDRIRIHDAVVAAVAEGEVPDPLPKVKAPPDGIAYGFNTRYVSEGGCDSTLTFGKSNSLRAASDTGPQALTITSNLSPRREANASPTMLQSPRTSRLVHASFEVPPAIGASAAAAALLVVNEQKPYLPSHVGLRSVSVPGGIAGSQSHSPTSMGSPRAANSFYAITPRSRMAISHGGDPEQASSTSPSRQLSTRDPIRENELQGSAQLPDAASLAEPAGPATCHGTGPGMLKKPDAKESADSTSVTARPWNLATLPIAASAGSAWVGADDTGAPMQPHRASSASAYPPFGSSTDERPEGFLLPRLRDGTDFQWCDVPPAACLDFNDRVLLDDEIASPDEYPRIQMLRELVLEALRLVERDCKAMESSLAALNMSHAELDEASMRCRTRSLSSPELQAMLRDEVVLMPLAGELDATDTGDMANEALATVLQRLSTVLDRLRRLEESTAEMEQALARERQVRTDAEADAARLKVDRNETNAALAMTRELLAASQQQLEQLRAQFNEVNRELGAKSTEVAPLEQQQELEVDDSTRAATALPFGMGLIGVAQEDFPPMQNVLNATEMELEGLRVEHENLRAKSELQSTELRQLQTEVSGLRAARDKLVEELQDMQQLLLQHEAPSVEDVPLVALKDPTLSDGKAAARAPSRGAPGAVGAGCTWGKGHKSSVTASADFSLKNSSTCASGVGATLCSRRATPDTTPTKKASKDVPTSMRRISSGVRSPGGGTQMKPSVKRGVPQAPSSPQPSMAIRRSGPPSASGTPRDHYFALARLEEIQFQLAQAEAARQALECQLQAAQAVIASKDSELDTANLMLREYERRSLSAAGHAHKHAVELSASVNIPLLAGGDAVALLAITPGRRGPSRNAQDDNRALICPVGATHDQFDMIARLEELQAQCAELICRAADLDTQRGQSQLDAEERAAELQATKEYIQELEEEAELLRGLADKATRQMQEKERDMLVQEQALLEARAALERAQDDCDAQISYVEAQAAKLEDAQAELLAAQALALELETRDEEQSRADADALARLRDEVTLLRSQYATSQMALEEATQELAAAQAAAEGSGKAPTEHQQAIEDLRKRASEIDVRRQELAHNLSAAEDAQASLAEQLAAAAENREYLSSQLETVTGVRDDMAAQLANKQAALNDALERLGQGEASRQQLEKQLQMDAMELEKLRTSLAHMKMEHADLQKQVVNDRAAVRDLAEKLAETELARLELAEELKKSDATCKDLGQQLLLVQESCGEQQAALASAAEMQTRTEANLARTNAALEITAAKLATAGAARDLAYCKATAADSARQELEWQIDNAETKVQSLSVQVFELEQQLRSALEREALMQEQATAFAQKRAAEAERAVESLQAALSDVQRVAWDDLGRHGSGTRLMTYFNQLRDVLNPFIQTQLETVRSEAAVQAAKVATLETKLAQAAIEQERLEIQAAAAAAHSQMLEEELRQARAENALLEEELAASRAEVAAQVKQFVLQADQLAAAHALNAEQEKLFTAEAATFKLQLEAARVDNVDLGERSACHVAELEAQIAAARSEGALQAARFTAEASRLEAQLGDARAALERQAQASATRIRFLEEQLAKAQASSIEQSDLHRAHIEELEDKLASARVAINEHTARTSAHVEDLEDQLAAARNDSASQAEKSRAQVATLLDQLVAARAEMAEQAHMSAARAADLEAQLNSARSFVAALVERSAAEVSDLVSQLDAARAAGALSADQAAREISKLEAQLGTAQSDHAALADRSASQVAELEAQLVAALAENTEQAKRSAAQASELESQLAAAMAVASEHAAAQTAELTAQLEAARANLSEQAERSSADAALLVKQLEAAHADIAMKMAQSAAHALTLEQQLCAARVKISELLSNSAAQSAALEARIITAQEQHAAQAEASAAQVAELEKQLAAAHVEMADQLKRSSSQIAALEEQLVAVHAEHSVLLERAAANTHLLEAQLAAAQAVIAEQVQSLTNHAATLETELAAALSEKSDLAARLALQTVELQAVLTAARTERDAEAERHATLVADLEAQLSASRVDTALHAGRAATMAAAFEEQMAAARGDRSAQAEQMRALEAELRSVVFALGAAKSTQEKQAENVQQLLEADLEQKKELDLRKSEAQQLRVAVAGLQVTLGQRESVVADLEVQLEKARQDLEVAVAAMGHLQTTEDRLQAAASAATAAGAAVSNAAAISAGQQQANLAVAAREQARLQAFHSYLEDIVGSHPLTVSGLRSEMSKLQAAQGAPVEQLRQVQEHASRQDAIAPEVHRKLQQRQQMIAAAELEAAGATVHQDQVAIAELAGGVQAALRTGQVVTGQEVLTADLAAEEQEVPSPGNAVDSAQRRAEAQHVVLLQAERKLSTAEITTAEAQARQRAAEEDVSVLRTLHAAFEMQASDGRQQSHIVKQQNEAMVRELTGIQQLLDRQRNVSTDLLECLTAKLKAADSDLRDARASAAELQTQLEDATGRVVAAERAALTADLEKRQVEARLAAALADSNNGRAMVQELSTELSRYREEVERVCKSLVAKQALLDKQEPQGAGSLQVGRSSQRRGSVPNAATATELQFDADLIEDFLEGCIWGMGLGASHAHAGATGLCTQLTPHRSLTADLESRALRLRALGGNVLELMSQGWHGSRLAGREPLGGPESASTGGADAG
ncbi:hypothetical protein VOLCADRAFT_118777 [Volvox carteri f. nagariensis]|uniref:Uncharacterized protein n=1 Tax=Volvox carteri f. nagariensis TaxID=3068 RepID=D8U7D0_VOLCA|nr:uncharacterized protein VOLCADRAFT_118777 [Volvox carteri f. nagariensis]EFJ44400.1 hypothetical protein VOLCADRAFT_118777 [Volvox carteri f. nagariensis]|eukprot:XP_002954507.1 hypothetical protein VOLCADRAFT_118777 [Volvox carteri f. nagariensis]